jgi:chloramphenicol 3-O-phosphotransferase
VQETAAVLIIGAPGAGKSTALEALTTRLELDGVAYGALEVEQLAWGDPWLEDEIALEQLRTVLALQRRAGRRLHALVATVETAEELRALVAAVAAERTLTVCLTAPPEVVAARIEAREPDRWPGKAWLVRHAAELAAAVPLLPGLDVVLETTEATPEETADAIAAAMRAREVV